jgi:phenylpropionate dioxygenase-like ring-hydroxylating dioxygenase large terminal subunit
VSDIACLEGYWHPVALESDLKGDEPLSVRLLDRQLVVFRSGTDVAVLEDLCIHRGTPLSLGRIDEKGFIQCGYHGWTFDRSGQCQGIPARGSEASVPRKARVAAFKATIRFGLVWCLIGPEKAPLPEWPSGEWDSPDFRNVMLPSTHWKSSAGRAIDNFLDLAHLPFVHEGALGTSDDAAVTGYSVSATAFGFTFSRREREISTPHSSDGEELLWENFIYFPFTAHIRKSTPSGRTTVISLIAAPTSSKETDFFFGLSRNYDTEPQSDQTYIDFHYEVSAQDRRIVEQQKPEAIPTSLREELHIKGVDDASMAYRKMLSDIGLSAEVIP